MTMLKAPYSQTSQNKGDGTINVGVYSGGENVPSARFRAHQYKEAMENHRIIMHERPSRVGKYPPRKRWLRPLWFGAALTERILDLPGSFNHDLNFLQRELISTFTTIEPFLKKPLIFDVDDAIWLHRGGRFCQKIASMAETIICGNEYIADYFNKYNNNIYILPTAVDTSRFVPTPNVNLTAKNSVIGWSGTSGNLHELESIEKALHQIMKNFNNVKLRVICDRPPQLISLPSSRVEYIKWSKEVEVNALQDLAIGIMPLKDNQWTRGKCAFKMLTYMSCGVPVVASPVGMNADILKKAEVGFGPKNIQEWIISLSDLLTHQELSRKAGINGRRLVESEYSINALSSKLANIIRNTL